ncbi:hydrogenase expression/formation protein HypE [hot springs metagenome]|uniref:Hydrogenase expression/formation protein HypE n=1 Tax=hot springs metagenome TaxID=433727 RepID=A0A5J4L3Z1_9ZZZZ
MEKILLGHGSGGKLMHDLIREYFVPEFGLKELNDSAIIELGYNVVRTPESMQLPGDTVARNISVPSKVRKQALQSNNPEIALPSACNNKFRFAFTTDSYVVSPIFFPGGNIGELAVNGTVNDLSMVGAVPLYLSVGFIIEEGFPFNSLKTILSSMAESARRAGVKIVAGDTKVVDKGKGDGIFINTSGVGIIPDGIELSPSNISAGDRVIVSGFIGNHGIAVLSERNGLFFDPPVLSDTASLNGLVKFMFDAASKSAISNPHSSIKMMRDPTRGGIATTLKELAIESNLCIIIYEEAMPISNGVRGACELLGLDPLYIANEGILIAIVSPDMANLLVEQMRLHPMGRDAVIIGEVVDSDQRTNGMVLLKTSIGGTRIIDMLAGEQLPRIC